MNDIWYMLDDGAWFKIKYRPEISDLSDVFEFMEDYELKFKKGQTLTMDYGCMDKQIKNKELITEEEFLNVDKSRYIKVDNDFWPKGDERVYYNEEEIPSELIGELKSELSDSNWNYFINNDNCCIKRNQVIDMRTNPFTLKDLGWGLFLTIKENQKD